MNLSYKDKSNTNFFLLKYWSVVLVVVWLNVILFWAQIKHLGEGKKENKNQHFISYTTVLHELWEENNET